MRVGRWSERIRIESEWNPRSVAWSPDSSRLAVGHSKGGVLIYPSDLSGEPDRLLGHAGPVDCVLFSPSGRTLITGGRDDDVRFWDLETGQTKMVSRIHDRNIRSISFAGGSEVLMTADAGGVLRLWPADDQAGTMSD
jgi:WD40 repeat protein